MVASNENHDKHPDLFTEAEALVYLHMPTDEAGVRTLETLRDTHELRGFKVGRGLMYHRRHLDALVIRLAGIDADTQQAAGQGTHGALKMNRRAG